MKMNKKVLHLISSAGLFGAEKVMLQLCKGLSNTDYNPIVGIIANPANLHLPIEHEAVKENLNVKVFNCNGKFNIKTIKEIRYFIKVNKIDIIHSHGYKSNFYAFVSTFNFMIKRITTCHNWISKTMKKKLYERLDKFLIRKFDRVIVVSDRLEEEVIRNGVARGKIKVIHNGIEVENFEDSGCKLQIKKTFGIKENELIAGTVGRLTEEKGHIYLIKAFAIITSVNPDIKLLIIGEGPLKKDLESQVKNLDLEGKVIFAGFRSEVQKMLSIMDIFVLPSLDEGMPIALLEAMAAKLPAVVTNVGGVPRIIKNGYSGIAVEPKNVLMLSAAVGNLLKDKKRCEYLSQNAFNTVKEVYSARKMIQNYLDVYGSVLKGQN